MVRCIEQEREEEDEASVPEEINTLYFLYQRQSECFGENVKSGFVVV